MDIEVVDDGRGDNNNLDHLNETMLSIKQVLLDQHESLKSIARWQDQTALYTFHLQNIKVDMNQVRKFGEPINQIAVRIDKIATTLDAIALDQRPPDDGDGPDANALLPALNEIVQNTRETADGIQDLAMAIREDQEDKRDVKEKVTPDTDNKKVKKEKEKAEGTVSSAFQEVTSFFKKLLGFFAISALALVPIFAGSDKLFAGLKEFFGSVFNFFTEVTKFFMQNVIPAMNFLFEGLVAFFNKLTGPLGRLGAEIGNALKLIGPKLFNAVSPILDFIGNGIIKAVDFFTSVVALIGPAFDVIGQFVKDIRDKFQKVDFQLSERGEQFFTFFDGLFKKLINQDADSILTMFEKTLQGMFNAILDMAIITIRTVKSIELFNSGMTDEQIEREKLQATEGLLSMKFVQEGSAAEARFKDFARPGESADDARKRLERMREQGQPLPFESPSEVITMLANIDELQDRFDQENISNIQSLDKSSQSVPSILGGQHTRTTLKGLDRIPGLENLGSQADFQIKNIKDGQGNIFRKEIVDGPSAMTDEQKIQIEDLLMAMEKFPDQVGNPPPPPADPVSGQSFFQEGVTVPPAPTASTGQNLGVLERIIQTNKTLGINGLGMGTVMNTPIAINQNSSSADKAFMQYYNFGIDSATLMAGFQPGRTK